MPVRLGGRRNTCGAWSQDAGTHLGGGPDRDRRARRGCPMREIFRRRRMWRPQRELRDSYDVVIIGGGSHGLATAYYLAERGITNVAVLEQRYIGSGAAGRNTTILRSNYKTPEGARFYDASVKLYEGLSPGAELQPAVLAVRAPDARPFRPRDVRDGQPRRGQPAAGDRLAPDRARRDQAPGAGDAASRTRTRRIRSSARSTTRRAGIIRHDAVVWGLARGADRGGAEIHPYTEVHGHRRDRRPRRPQVRTNRGKHPGRPGAQLHRRAGAR